MSGSATTVSFDELTQLHDVFTPLLAADVSKATLQTICDWAKGDDTTVERLATLGPLVDKLVADVGVGDDAAHVLRKKAAIYRFCLSRIDAIEAEEKAKQCGYFLALGAGENPPPITNGSSSAAQGSGGAATAAPPPLRPRAPDLDVRELHNRLFETETLNGVPMEHVIEVAYRAAEIFRQERNIVSVAMPCVAVGDIHGQFLDLKHNIIKNGGPISETRYLFLGDYVDRGDDSILSVTFLLTAKILYPDRVFMIRGNHESRQTNCIYGFLSECRTRFPYSPAMQPGSTPPTAAMGNGSPPAHELFNFLGDHPVWAVFNEVFDSLPVAAIIGSRMFCVHGGLSPDAESLDAILAVNRKADIEEGVLADLTWSDPSGSQGYHFNSRGCGHLFGIDVTDRFITSNGFELVVRAHQCVRKGFQFDHDNKLLTIFSAPNYCGQGNDGAIMKVDADGKYEFVQFQAVPRTASPTSGANGGGLSFGLPIYFQRN